MPLRYAAATAVAALVVASPAGASPVVHQATGSSPSELQMQMFAAMAGCRAGLGNPNLNDGPAAPGGRRESTFSEALNAPLPWDFFLVDHTRGLRLPRVGPRVSPFSFKDIESSYSFGGGDNPADPKLFGNNTNRTTKISFRVAGSESAGWVRGFGAWFLDADIAGASKIKYYGPNDESIGSYDVPVNGNLNMLCVTFTDEHVTRVELTSGTDALHAGVVDNGTTDVVVNDLFLWSDPRPLPAEGESFEDGLAGWVPSGGPHGFESDATEAHAGTRSVAVPDASSATNLSLTAPFAVAVPAGAPSAALRFRHLHDVAPNDGGFVEVSVDGGSVWNEPPPSQFVAYPPASALPGGLTGWAGDSGGWRLSELDLGPYAGKTILIRFRFTSDNTCCGRPGWWIDDVVLRAGPSPETGAAEEIATGGAVLTGAVRPNESPTATAFDLGTSEAYSTRTEFAGADGGSRMVGVRRAVDGLLADTEYHYRLVARNDEGLTVGADRTFRTAAAPSAPLGGTPPPPAAPALDRTKPVITGLRLTGSGRGRVVALTLSERARVTLRLERIAAGRRLGRRCVAPPRAPEGRRCDRRVPRAGTVVKPGTAGANRIALPAKLAGRTIANGRYALVAVAVDTAGNASKRAVARVRIR